MLRLSILSSVLPLVLAGGVAHDWTSVAAHQCSGLTTSSARSVAFTDDPTAATVKVQIVDSAETADLAIADDIDTDDESGCGIVEAARLVTITARPRAGAPVVHLSRTGGADYRIYVDSTRISPKKAAALLVSIRGGHARLAASGF